MKSIRFLLFVLFSFLLTFNLQAQSVDSLTNGVEVQITHSNGSAVGFLYRNCVNILTVQITGLGENYKPHFSAVGGSVTLDKNDKTLIRFLPSENEVVLKVGHFVKRNVVEVKRIKFKCIATPLPELVLYVDGKRWDGQTPVSRLSKALISIEADKDFAMSMPEASTYQIVGLSASKLQAYGIMTLVKNRLNSETSQYPKVEFELFDLWTKEEEVLNLTIKVDEIVRFDADGRRVVEPYPLSRLAFSIPVVP